MQHGGPLLVLALAALTIAIVLLATAGSSRDASDAERWMRQLPAVRSVTGAPNHPRGWGAAGHTMPATMAVPDARQRAEAPSPQSVSDDIFGGFVGFTPKRSAMTVFGWLWGQFLDHTIVASAPGSMVNTLTPFIDGSTVYGHTDAITAPLRTFADGLMRVGAGDLLPVNATSGKLMAGDERRGVHAGLAAMHTLFVREHNRFAREYAREHAGHSDEQLFQAARTWVAGVIQSVTVHEWLPTLLGPDHRLGRLAYSIDANPEQSREHSTVCFRFGHSMVTTHIGALALDRSFDEARTYLERHGIDALLGAAMRERGQGVDTFIVDPMRTRHPFTLVTLNLDRARERGIAPYSAFRARARLPPAAHWLGAPHAGGVTTDAALATALRRLYGPDPGAPTVDAYVGLLAEDHARASELGPSVAECVREQFHRSITGDAYYHAWFANDAVLTEYRERIAARRLSDVLRDNTDIAVGRARNVFVYAASST